jgi:hypothetical protein
MADRELERQVERLQSVMTPAFIKQAVETLVHQGEDIGGGVNAIRLVRHLLGDPGLGDVEATWAYDRLKPAFATIFDQIPSLYYFEGD